MPIQPQPHKGPWANLLLKRMQEWNCNQRAMAELLDVTETRISDWIHGRHEPSDAMKARIVEELKPAAHEVAPDWLRPALSTPAPPPPPELHTRRTGTQHTPKPGAVA